MVRTRGERETDPARFVQVMRERIYGGLSCLSTLMVLTHNSEAVSALPALVDVIVSAGSLWAASIVADYVAHLAGHGSPPSGPERLHMFQASGQILQAAALPALFLVLAALGVIQVHAALRAGVIAAIAALGVFALLAARRTGLPAWKRAALVVALVGLGALVVVVKVLAH